MLETRLFTIRLAAIRLAVLATLLTLSALPAAAQSAYPTRPVRIIVPYPAGASTDNIARPLAERLSRALGQQFVIENKGGAGGALGAEVMAKSAPDGYTIMVSPQTPVVVLPNLRKMPYDAATDFMPVARMSEVITGFAVHPSLGVRTLTEFIALAKQKPGQIVFVSAGVGTITHLRGEMLKLMAGIDLLHVPYKGNGEALPDLLAGNVHAMFEAIVFPHVKAGKLTLLAVVDDVRHPDFPDAPTIKESGFPDYELPIWFGTYAPKGTPPVVIQTLHREISKIHGDSAFKEKQMALGMRVYDKADTPEEMARRIATQTLVFRDIMVRAKVSVE
jgi:tripartite-type tricarboxylate transporter receptor subunit TctC